MLLILLLVKDNWREQAFTHFTKPYPNEKCEGDFTPMEHGLWCGVLSRERAI